MSINDFWFSCDDISIARKLRLAVTRNLYGQGLLERKDAIDILSGALTLGDASTIYDDSECLDEIIPEMENAE